MNGARGKSSGFTLLETLVYAAILTIIALAAITSAIGMSRSLLHAKAMSEVKNGGTVAMERLIREIQTASSVDAAASTLGASPGRLVLNTTDTLGAARTVEFYSSGQSIGILDGGTDKGALVGNNIEITNLVFYHVVTPKSAFVKIEMSLSNKKVPTLGARNFYGTAVLRGGY